MSKDPVSRPVNKHAKVETPYEYQQRKEKEKRLADLAERFPNQAVGDSQVLQGGSPSQFGSMEVMRPSPGAPLQLPNGMRTPVAANPVLAGHEGQSKPQQAPPPELSNGEFSQDPNAFYNLPKSN